jgi:hypothetical protein
MGWYWAPGITSCPAILIGISPRTHNYHAFHGGKIVAGLLPISLVFLPPPGNSDGQIGRLRRPDSLAWIITHERPVSARASRAAQASSPRMRLPQRPDCTSMACALRGEASCEFWSKLAHQNLPRNSSGAAPFAWGKDRTADGARTEVEWNRCRR